MTSRPGVRARPQESADARDAFASSMAGSRGVSDARPVLARPDTEAPGAHPIVAAMPEWESSLFQGARRASADGTAIRGGVLLTRADGRGPSKPDLVASNRS